MIVLVGSLLLLSLFFLRAPTLIFLYWLSLACFYVCATLILLLYFTFYWVFIAVVATCRWLFKALEPMCLFLLDHFQTAFSESMKYLRTQLDHCCSAFFKPMCRSMLDHTKSAFFESMKYFRTLLDHSCSGFLKSMKYFCTLRPKNRPVPPVPPRNHTQYGTYTKPGKPSVPPASPRNRRGYEAYTQPKNQDETKQNSSDNVCTDRQKMKESYEYRRAMEAEWAARQRELQRQAEEARRQRNKRAENKSAKANERRQKQHTDEQKPQTSRHGKDETKLNQKEKFREEIRKKLKELEKCTDMSSLLRRLGFHLPPHPSRDQVRSAYKEACLLFHPDKLVRADWHHQIEGEEKFKLISSMNISSL